jgi:hypothetical protein
MEVEIFDWKGSTNELYEKPCFSVCQWGGKVLYFIAMKYGSEIN